MSDAGHEYLVVPAPRQAPRIKGIRSAPERFAHAVAEVMNEAAREGWEYLRTDTLPMVARTGWLGAATVTPQELLVFRRAVAMRRPERLEPAAPVFASEGARQGDVTRIATRQEPRTTARHEGDEESGPRPGSGQTPRLGGARRD